MNRLQPRQAEILPSSTHTANTSSQTTSTRLTPGCSLPTEIKPEEAETQFTFTPSVREELCRDRFQKEQSRPSNAEGQNSVPENSQTCSAKVSIIKTCEDGIAKYSIPSPNASSGCPRRSSTDASTKKTYEGGQGRSSATAQHAMPTSSSSSSKNISEDMSTAEICESGRAGPSSAATNGMSDSSQKCSEEKCVAGSVEDGPAEPSLPVQQSVLDESTHRGTRKFSTASFVIPSEKIDSALHTLKSELMAMREQDLQLLKQLIHINDNIRRLKRARWLQKGGRTASCGALGARSPPCLPPGTAPSGPKERTSMLLRQRSEPGLLGLPYHRRVSTLTSTSSFETIEDEEEEADSLYGSFSDLPSDNSPVPSPLSPSIQPTPSTPVTRCLAPYTSLTFTQEELWRGESSYGEILKRNVRLWKWSVAREKETGIVDGHPCVL